MDNRPHHPRREFESRTEESDAATESDSTVETDSTFVAALKLIGVFAVSGLAIFVARGYVGSGDAQADVGRCAKLSGNTAAAAMEPRDCADPEANYVVAQRLAGADAACAGADYAGYHQTGDDAFTLCLRLNVVEGDCVNGSMAGTVTRVRCTAAADFEVERMVRGLADRSACGAAATEENTLVYAVPEPLTFCLVRPR